MRKLLILICLFISAQLSAQVYQVMPQYGYQTARMRMDSVLIVPSDTIRNKSGVARIGTQLYAGNGSYWTLAGGADSSVLFTNYRADTMRSNLYANKVPYTGATQDVDLGAHKISAQTVQVKGTGGAGHLGLKHQSAAATASGQETSIYADNNGDVAWKNDNLYITTLKTSGNTADRVYTFPDSTGTVALLSNVNVKQDTATAWKTGGNFNVNAGQFIGSHNNASLRFRTNNLERMILDSTGSIGIATTTPDPVYKLNINGKTFASDEIRLTNNNKLLFNYSNNTTQGFGITQNASNLFSIRNYNWSYNPFSIIDTNKDSSQNGLIGIYQDNPLSTLDIVGTMRNSRSAFLATSSGNVGIGTTTPSSTAELDVTSTTSGMLIPRMTTTQRNAISTPATGLMIYNTTDSSHYTYDGVRWNRQLSANGLQTITGTPQTGSSAVGALDISQTWNTTGTPSAIKLNVTNTASNGNSRLMDLQVGGVSQFRVQTNSGVYVGNNTSFAGMRYNADQLFLTSNITGTTAGDDFNFTSGQGTRTFTTGTNNVINIRNGASQAFAPTSGTGVLNIINIPTVINQTGGANGITRGLHINPTLTSAADFRGIEVTNGSIVLPYATASATYAIKTSDYLLNFTSGTFTATLPTAVGCTGKNYILKNAGTGAVTIATTSSQTIDGATTYSLGSQYKYVHVVSDGANWIITANN